VLPCLTRLGSVSQTPRTDHRPSGSVQTLASITAKDAKDAKEELMLNVSFMNWI